MLELGASFIIRDAKNKVNSENIAFSTQSVQLIQSKRIIQGKSSWAKNWAYIRCSEFLSHSMVSHLSKLLCLCLTTVVLR